MNNNIPKQIKQDPRWLGWRYEERNGKRTKVPLHVADPKRKASSTDPNSWGSYSVATLNHYPNLGFVLGGGWFGIDMDNCVDADGVISNEAQAVLDMFQHVYVEFSPSGKGIHIIGRASLKTKGVRRGGIEVYTEGRYFTMTGDVLRDTSTFEDEGKALERLMQFLRPEKELAQRAGGGQQTQSDAAIIERLRASKMGRVWDGDTSTVSKRADGTADLSSRDFVLAKAICYFTQDLEQVERIMRLSPCYRAKWDRKDYLPNTIANALQSRLQGGDKAKKPLRRKAAVKLLRRTVEAFEWNALGRTDLLVYADILRQAIIYGGVRVDDTLTLSYSVRMQALQTGKSASTIHRSRQRLVKLGLITKIETDQTALNETTALRLCQPKCCTHFENSSSQTALLHSFALGVIDQRLGLIEDRKALAAAWLLKMKELNQRRASLVAMFGKSVYRWWRIAEDAGLQTLEAVQNLRNHPAVVLRRQSKVAMFVREWQAYAIVKAARERYKRFLDGKKSFFQQKQRAALATAVLPF